MACCHGCRARSQLGSLRLRIDLETGRDDRSPHGDPRLDIKRLPHESLESAFHDDAPPGTKVMEHDNRIRAVFLRYSRRCSGIGLGPSAHGLQRLGRRGVLEEELCLLYPRGGHTLSAYSGERLVIQLLDYPHQDWPVKRDESKLPRFLSPAKIRAKDRIGQRVDGRALISGSLLQRAVQRS